MGFTKLFSSIVTSSVWCEDDVTLRVWIAMLAMCDSSGVVEGSVPGMASLCRVSIEDFEAALLRLTSPDPHSRTPDHEGRRVEACAGGWRILNYASYREKPQDKDGSRAPYFRERRRERATSTCSAQQGGVARYTEERRESTETTTPPFPPSLPRGGDVRATDGADLAGLVDAAAECLIEHGVPARRRERRRLREALRAGFTLDQVRDAITRDPRCFTVQARV